MLSGEWNNGFVVEDENGNQYVWVPVTNKEVLGVPKLEKRDLKEEPLIEKEYCFDNSYEEFIISSLENGGFYISRYEIGKDGENIVSKPNKELLQNLTRKETMKKIEEMYTNKNFTCELINGYAYDTLLKWLMDNNNIDIFKIDIESEVLTGRNSCYRIFDIFDNIMEYTNENSYETVVVRGFCNERWTIDGYKPKNTRYAMLEHETFFNIETLLTARTIIYR